MSKTKAIHFFATERDLVNVLQAAECDRPLKYTQAGMFDEPIASTFGSCLQLPNLGTAASGDQNLEPFWLITDATANIQFEVVPQRRGGTRFGIDPGTNPASVVLWPGGRFDNSCIVAGKISTTMANSVSMQLMNLFTREIKRRFKRIRSFFVGPDAENLLDAGYRLAHSAQSPVECDLRKD